LLEEKNIVAEIAALKRTKKFLVENPFSAGDEQANIETLKPELDRTDILVKEHDLKLDVLKKEMESLEAELKESSENVSGLVNKKKDLQTRLRALRTEKQQLYDTYKEAQDKWFTKQKEIREAKKLEELKTAELEKAQQKLRDAEEQLEDANVQAFGGEIALVDALIKFFEGLIAVKKDETTLQDSNSDELASYVPRSTLLVRKQDREEDFIVFGGKKNKKGRKAQVGAAPKPLKVDLLVLEQMQSLEVKLPKTTAEVPATIAELKKKKEFYAENSEKQTILNKKTAMERYEQLKKEVVVEDLE
jgi:DNA repair exonuclease SbcCD ATPase subunit